MAAVRTCSRGSEYRQPELYCLINLITTIPTSFTASSSAAAARVFLSTQRQQPPPVKKVSTDSPAAAPPAPRQLQQQQLRTCPPSPSSHCLSNKLSKLSNFYSRTLPAPQQQQQRHAPVHQRQQLLGGRRLVIVMGGNNELGALRQRPPCLEECLCCFELHINVGSTQRSSAAQRGQPWLLRPRVLAPAASSSRGQQARLNQVKAGLRRAGQGR